MKINFYRCSCLNLDIQVASKNKSLNECRKCGCCKWGTHLQEPMKSVCECDSQHFTALPQVQMFESQQRKHRCRPLNQQHLRNPGRPWIPPNPTAQWLAFGTLRPNHVTFYCVPLINRLWSMKSKEYLLLCVLCVAKQYILQHCHLRALDKIFIELCLNCKI